MEVSEHEAHGAGYQSERNEEDVCRLEVVKREFIKEPSTCVIKYYESKWIHDQYSTIICHCLILFPQSEYTRSDGTGYPLSGIASVRHIFVQQSQWIACRSHASDNHPLWFAAVLNRQDCPARNSSSVGSRDAVFFPLCSGEIRRIASSVSWLTASMALSMALFIIENTSDASIKDRHRASAMQESVICRCSMIACFL